MCMGDMLLTVKKDLLCWLVAAAREAVGQLDIK